VRTMAGALMITGGILQYIVLGAMVEQGSWTRTVLFALMCGLVAGGFSILKGKKGKE
jgi:hypothetical protein